MIDTFEGRHLRFFLAKFRLFVKRTGFDITPRRYAHNLQELIWLFEESGIDLQIIYDIGANEGKWSRRVREAQKLKSRFYLFEPNDTYRTQYEKLGFANYFNVILSDSEKEVNFFGIGSTGDSYYKEVGNQEIARAKPQKRAAISLDRLRQNLDLPQPDFIKIDTQGSELDIIKGSASTLKDVKLLLIECPILEYNENAPRFEEYIELLTKLNFVPIELTEIHIVNNKLVQVDIAFVNGKIFSKIRNR